MDDTLEGWHFLRADRTTGSGGLLIEVGQHLTLDGKRKMELCDWGFHGSEEPLHALRYAPGFVVERVRYSGNIVRGDDKFCAQERTCLWMAEARPVIIGFACWAATGALLGARKVDPRSWVMIEVVQEWIAGRATIEQVREARIAAVPAVPAYAASGDDVPDVPEVVYAAPYAASAASDAAYAAAYAAAGDGFPDVAYAASYAASAASASASAASASARGEVRAMLNAELGRRLRELAPR